MIERALDYMSLMVVSVLLDGAVVLMRRRSRDNPSGPTPLENPANPGHDSTVVR
jgi:hypothetical protein